MNEICQLDVDDIRELEGIYYFAVQDDGDKSGKKIKSKAGDGKLFPDLKSDSREYYSGNFQKGFGRYLVTCGAKSPKASFHFFRHGFRDALREANVSVELTERICGWSGAGMQSRYGSGPKIGALSSSVEKIEYPNLILQYSKEI